MRRKLIPFLFCFTSFFLLENYTIAQKYFGVSQQEFGKSRIQYKRFEWKTIKSNNFEFNFYRGGDQLAKNAAEKAEFEYGRITETLGYTPFSAMKIFIYNSPEDLNQSNIGLSAPSELEGGLLNLTNTRIEIAYDKNDSLFNKKLIKEITNLFVYDMLYGGSLKESVQSQLLLMVPEWYINGISSYIAEPDNGYLFESFKANSFNIDSRKLNNLTGKEAEIVGQSIWNYIGIKYGKDNISNILNLTRIIRNEQSSITSTLGLSFNKFLKNWQAFYQNNELDNTKEIQINVVKEEAEKNIEEKAKTVLNLKSGEVDTDNYQFAESSLLKFKNQKVVLDELGSQKTQNGTSGYKRTKEELKLSPTKAYQNLMVSNDVALDIIMDPVRRFGFGTKLILNDLLENHIVTISSYVRPSTPFFKNYDYAISYGNYTKKIDYKLAYERRSINFEVIDAANNYLFRPLKIFPADDNLISRRIMSQRMTGTAIYPFSNNLKLIGNASYLKTTDIEYELPGRDNLNSYYINPNLALVFDNSKVKSTNVSLGTKAMISIEKNLSIGKSFQNFDKVNIDVRHYHKLTRGLILAARFNYGNSTGNSPKFTFLGGVENWINKSVYNAIGLLPGTAGDFRDILFYNFPGNLRGFDFARLFGNNHLLTNIELRASMVEYFPQSSITSSFLRNLQFTLFYDLGTAWNGNKGPWSKQNSLNTVLLGTDGKSPFFAEVTNFKNPFLMGFGGGVRTTVLGFLVKADYGFGREDKEIGKPKLYLSFGTDF